MAACRKIGLSALVISIALGSASCSLIPGTDGTVNDDIPYRRSDASIKALSVPPGLSKPDYSDTYRVSNAPLPTAGASAGNAVSTVQARPAKPAIQVALATSKSGEPMLAVNAPLNNSWPLVGAMLPNIGFEVVKQQPEEGLYTAEYSGIEGETANFTDKINSFLSGVAVGENKTRIKVGDADGLRIGQTYLIALSGNQAQQSFVFVADRQGKPAAKAIANEILGRLKAEFER